MNGVYIPDMWGPGEADRLWCYRGEYRDWETDRKSTRLNSSH